MKTISSNLLNAVKQEVVGHYIIGKKLFGAENSFEARDKNNGKQLVVKVFDVAKLGKQEVGEITHRVEQLMDLSLKGIVQVLQHITQNGKLYVFQEFIENGSIQHVAGIITERLIVNYAKQLAFVLFQLGVGNNLQCGCLQL